MTTITPTDEQVEQVARVMCRAEGEDPDERPTGRVKPYWTIWGEALDAVGESIYQAGTADGFLKGWDESLAAGGKEIKKARKTRRLDRFTWSAGGFAAASALHGILRVTGVYS